MLLSSTPRLVPRVAMMNENSPICVSEKPDSRASLSGWPVANMPKVPNTIMPTMTTTASRAMTLQCCVITVGLTIMPTEMKNTAPKRSLTDEMSRSMRSASMVPARIEPMTKAPNAAEKPDWMENSTMAKHNPMAIISICSSLM